MPDLKADLVLEGGGVKGIALVGAYSVIEERGYAINRVAGTSAGSIAGALIAARMSAKELETEMRGLDYSNFKDKDLLDKIPLVGKALSVMFEDGIYEGDYARNWVGDLLAKKGVKTFADLPYDDPKLDPDQHFRLVVMASDITRGRLRKLPWDYPVYTLKPGGQEVADAVRASMSIPFFFRVAKLTSTSGLTSTLVDGGLLSNFPLDTFDRSDGKSPRWPTFGVTVLPNLPQGNDKAIPGLAPLHWFGGPTLLENVITTMIVGRDQAYLNQPWVSARTIRVDSTDVGFLDFDISKKHVEALYKKGHAAAEGFLSTWDWRAYVNEFRSGG